MGEHDLIRKAKATRKERKVFSREEQLLAYAWAKDEVALREVQRAMGYKSPQIYGFLARALRQHIKGL